MTRAVLGIIGGSGIYDLPGLENVRDEVIESPWGEPSAALRRGVIAGLPIVFLPRMARDTLSPSDINYRANIDVLKRAGVTDLISPFACGLFKEDVYAAPFVLVDQFADRTHKRKSSCSSAEAASPTSRWPIRYRRAACASGRGREGRRLHRGGRRTTSAWNCSSSCWPESLTYKAQGYAVIGMTNMPEAKLAREAEICYASVAMVTDFDCWHPDHDAASSVQ